MKKTLAALAVLGAFGASAMAADVTLYGRIDAGLYYQHNDMDVQGEDSTDNLQMKDGISTGSRFGLKGTEELGNGYKVGFVLENGFDVDNGALGDSSRLFDRESILFVDGGFGKLAFGRAAILGSDSGSFNILGAVNSFGTGWSDIGSQNFVFSTIATRWDNMIAYQSPSFAGFKVHAQYSMGSNSYENKPTSDRYMGLGVTYDNGPLSLVALLESINEKSNTWNDPDDQIRFTLGGNYDFEVVKVYGAVQYFKDADQLNTTAFSDVALVKVADTAVKTWDQLEGFGVVLGADVPLAGGTLKGSVGYIDAEDDGTMEKLLGAKIKGEVKGFMAALGYKYPLSKRTYVYGGMGYDQTKYELSYAGYSVDQKPNNYYATFGMAHYF